MLLVYLRLRLLLLLPVKNSEFKAQCPTKKRWSLFKLTLTIMGRTPRTAFGDAKRGCCRFCTTPRPIGRMPARCLAGCACLCLYSAIDICVPLCRVMMRCSLLSLLCCKMVKFSVGCCWVVGCFVIRAAWIESSRSSTVAGFVDTVDVDAVATFCVCT